MSTWLEKMNARFESVHEAKKMDPVDKEALKKDFASRKDKDIDNDGDVDSSDKYLHNRRKTISKATKGKETETQVDEALSEFSLEDLESYMVSEMFDELDEDMKKSVSNFVNKAKNTVGNARRKVFGLNKKEKEMVQRRRDARDYALHKSISDLEKKHKGAFPRKPSTIDEISNKKLTGYAKASYNDVLRRRANRPPGQGDESDPKIGKRLAMNKLAHKKGAFKDEMKARQARAKMNKEGYELEEKTIAPATHKGYQDPMDKGLSPSAKVELGRTTDAPSDAFDANKVIAKTFKDMRASLKNRKLRKGDQDTGDKAPVKNDGK